MKLRLKDTIKMIFYEKFESFLCLSVIPSLLGLFLSQYQNQISKGIIFFVLYNILWIVIFRFNIKK